MVPGAVGKTKWKSRMRVLWQAVSALAKWDGMVVLMNSDLEAGRILVT
jgi:hypothetical protein